MSSLIPTHSAKHLVNGMSEYLATSFSLAEQTTASSLKEFLTDPELGIFNGPYIRTRLPYAPATDWENILGWLPEGFIPYRHQAAAFRRLSSLANNQERKPDPTLVVTGTGSGKTEAFLYPVLDHCRRHQSAGIKALILYPMNALANDQAERLRDLILDNEELSGIRAGIYTGDQVDQNRAAVTKDGLITDRDTMRQSPPDILLTNYKMLDQLLLRDEDEGLWQHSAETLQYLVLDEFHTYDGAQGTDVALLLRRMGLKLKRYQPEGFLTEDEKARPLGKITPVATSATLGDDAAEPTEMLDFAHTIFGHKISAEAVVRETMLTLDQWRESIADFLGGKGSPSAQPTENQVKEINKMIAEDDSGRDHSDVVHEVFCREVFNCSPDLESAVLAAAENELVHNVLAHSQRPVPLEKPEEEGGPTLVNAVLDTRTQRLPESGAAEFLSHTLTELAHLRAAFVDIYGWNGKKFPGVETHLWVREVSRVDRLVEPDAMGAEMFRWSDDGNTDGNWLPACYCRNCGRSGWMTAMLPGEESLEVNPQAIRRLSVQKATLQRPLIDAANEARIGHDRSEDKESRLAWLDLPNHQLLTTRPEDEVLERGGIVPVLTYYGDNIETLATQDTCPSCGEADSIRFLGSRVSTLLSVAISNLFGLSDLDSTEKKTLVFVDSVQDAAHRAGFVQSRARTFAFRTRTRQVVGQESLLLSELPDRLMASTAEDELPQRARFELLPPRVANSSLFSAYWEQEPSESQHAQAAARLRDVLELDLALEFGDRADLVRSLVSTGALSVHVDASDEQLTEVIRKLGMLELGDREIQWARGVLEYMRIQGGIRTRLLDSFLADDGNTYLLNSREARAWGSPGFPIGGAPHFPRVGKKLNTSRFGEATTQLASDRAWYARWTASTLGMNGVNAAEQVSRLFQELANIGILTAIATKSGGTIYVLEPSAIRIVPENEAQILECEGCHFRLGVDAHGRQVLSGAVCFSSGCEGKFTIVANEDNYYRQLYNSDNSRTVVAKEHTGLLENEDRKAVEDEFKKPVSEQSPDAPNVLVATPTLEMGIDIGDLSTVMLASLPDSVASYVQRVGRAGRLTGNSLVVALIQGRGRALARLESPLKTIGGAVQPPAAYLSAREILHRQFAAYVIDSTDLQDHGVKPRLAEDVFGKDRSVVDVLQELIDAGLETELAEFSASLGPFVPEHVLTELKDWVNNEFSTNLDRAREKWQEGKHEIFKRLETLEKSVSELRKANEANSADEETEEQLKKTEASLKYTRRQIQKEFTQDPWISSLERAGLLPNFTLLDDSVQFNLQLSHQDAYGNIEPEAREYKRGVSSALYELAPGSTFYVQGIEATIDSVDLGPEGSAIERWRLCPACSYCATETEGDPIPASCPKCGNATYRDRGQVKNVVEMRKVSASVDFARSAITDSREDRRGLNFERTLAMIVPNEEYGESWYLKNTGFGVRYLPTVEMRWLNLGQPMGGPREDLAAKSVEAPLFRVCRECGHLDSEAGSNRWQDHKPYCSLRHSITEDTVSFALGRTLRTQGVLMHLPLTLAAADQNTLPSLIAAIRLGFKEYLGGNPDHLDVTEVKAPPARNETPVDMLLLHDTIPGGTGYLAQFTDSHETRKLLEVAYRKLAACPCQNEGRDACPNCLIPYANGHELSKTSRATALSGLAKILSDDEYLEDSGDPLETTWEITPEPPKHPDDTVLEVRGLQLLRKGLVKRGAKISERTVGNRAQWRFSFGHSPHTWTMIAQKDFGFTRPDLYFETEDTNLPISKIALYFDGAKYHLSSVTQDIEKRNGLSAGRTGEEILPWTLTWSDLDIHEKYVEEEPIAEPVWFDRGQSGNINKAINLDDTRHEFLLKDPLTQLLDVLEHPEYRWEQLATATGIHCMRHVSRKGENSLAPLRVRPAKENRFSLRFHQSGELDKRSWNEFWNLANLFYLDHNHVEVDVAYGSGRQVDLGTGELGGLDGGREREASPSREQWREALDIFDDEEDVIEVIEALIAAHVAVAPGVGEEISGVSTVLAWPEPKIALVFPEDAEDLPEEWHAIPVGGQAAEQLMKEIQ